MGQARGGKKLRRSSKHAAKYQVQFLRTQSNKHRQSDRRRRRLIEMPEQVNESGLPCKHGKPNQAQRIIRRSVREHRKNLQKNLRRHLIHIPQLELKG
jgi:hypothetical protein